MLGSSNSTLELHTGHVVVFADIRDAFARELPIKADNVVEMTFGPSSRPSIRTPLIATLAYLASQLLAMLPELPPGHLPPTFLLSHAVCHVDSLSHHIASSRLTLSHTLICTIYTAHVPTVSSQIRAGWPIHHLHISHPLFSESNPSLLCLCALVLRQTTCRTLEVFAHTGRTTCTCESDGTEL